MATTTHHTNFRNPAEVMSYIAKQDRKIGGAWAWQAIFSEVWITRAETPKGLPDHYISDHGSNNQYYWRGQWHDFPRYRKAREAKRGYINGQ